jgi:putative flippase GtrA
MTPFVRFNVVGVIGFAVQVTTLTLLVGAGLPVLMATCLAVEAALLHNFVWHECWTWPDGVPTTRGARLARFHVTNGLISMVGNGMLTTTLVHAGMPLLPATLVAVVSCALVNFAAANAWVFSARAWATECVLDRGTA